jgi:hypothetical protein
MAAADPGSPRAEALAVLHGQQQQAREQLGLTAPVAKTDALQLALERADRREKEGVVDGDRVRCGYFNYPLATERVRWARTRDILQRSSPGPDEDGVYLEMIARQAASVEVILRQEHTAAPHPQQQEICDRLLLGTLPTLTPGAFARRHGDFFFVQLSAGLIDFVYQAAKAVVLSWKPSTPAPGSMFAFKFEPEDVESVLAGNPMPLQLLRLTLENYLFKGWPRATGYSPPAVNYQAPLVILTHFNERFIVAHEYCHTLHDAMDIVQPGNAMHSEEFASDVMAFHLVAESGHQLDSVPPNVSTQGAFFVLTALDIVRQALDLARWQTVRPDHAFAGHPPVAQRLQVLRECYGQTVTREDNGLSIRPALAAARTLEQVWKHLLDDGLAARWQGRTLHRIWDVV